MADKKQDGGADPQPAAPAAPVQTPAADTGLVDVAAIAAALGQETPEAVSTPAANTEPNEPDPVEPAEQDEPEFTADADAVKDLSGKGKERVEKRIGQLTAQKKEAQELAATERLAREAAEARTAELEAQLAAVEAAGTRPAPTPAQTESSELMAAESEAEIAAYEARLAQYEDFIDEHIDEGYTPDDPEKTAYTPAQLRKMLRQVQRERSVLIPQAREVLKQRQTSNAEAKTLYPDLFKTNSEMSVRAAAILARVPGLKQLPNGMLLLGDALSKAAERAAPKPKAAEKKSPPVIPAPAATPKPASSTMQQVKSKVDMSKVQKSGGDRDAIAEGIAALGLG